MKNTFVYRNAKQNLNPDLSAFNKYGLFEANNGWVTDCFILENKKNCELTIKSIDLSYDNIGEDDKTVDILIGQMVNL